MTRVVATRPFTYAGVARFAGEVFTAAGLANDAALRTVGYIRDLDPAVSLVTDEDGREFTSAAFLARAQAERGAAAQEAAARDEARATLDERAAEREARVAEERRVHRDTWQCPPDVQSGGCGQVVAVALIAEHIRTHTPAAQARINAAHSREHEEWVRVHDMSVGSGGSAFTHH